MLAKGKRADVTVFDPDAEWTVDPNTFASKSQNTPFSGWKLKGKPIYTIVGEYEADAKKGMISITSPVARALLNKEPDDEVQVDEVAPGLRASLDWAQALAQRDRVRPVLVVDVVVDEVVSGDYVDGAVGVEVA